MNPINMEFTSATPVELSPAEASLYGTMDRIRQATNASIRRFVDAHRELLAGRTLDYGCGRPGTCRIPMPFRELIGAADYVGWDIADAEAHAECLPTSLRYDGILCTQVMQSIEDPAAQMRAFASWLKPGGHLVMTVPGAWEEIESECWRFTSRGLWVLCHKAGLKVLENRPILTMQLDATGGIRLAVVIGLVARREA